MQHSSWNSLVMPIGRTVPSSKPVVLALSCRHGMGSDRAPKYRAKPELRFVIDRKIIIESLKTPNAFHPWCKVISKYILMARISACIGKFPCIHLDIVAKIVPIAVISHTANSYSFYLSLHSSITKDSDFKVDILCNCNIILQCICVDWDLIFFLIKKDVLNLIKKNI